MANETIDKLKNAGYITITDDSQGIADKIGIPEAFPYEFVKLPDIEYTVQEGDRDGKMLLEWDYEKYISADIQEIKTGHIASLFRDSSNDKLNGFSITYRGDSVIQLIVASGEQYVGIRYNFVTKSFELANQGAPLSGKVGAVVKTNGYMIYF